MHLYYNRDMDYIFNVEKIKKLLLDFYIATDIAVTFYDSERKLVATSPRHSEYCLCIRADGARRGNCNRSNLAHMEEAAQKKSTVCYTCHAGLMETIIPVVYEETIIGFMQIGQFRDERGRYSSPDRVKKALLDYGLEAEQMLERYTELPVVSDEKFAALQKILLILIKNFWDDSLIRHNRSMLSIKIEQYVLEHIRERICVEEICRIFFLSKNALYRLFEAEFGMPIGKYILSRRIQLSKEALRNTAAPIATVAAECGFPNYNYFIRAFKKQMGVTPLQYRKTN